MGKIVIAPRKEQKNKDQIFRILHAALQPGIREDPKIKSIFSDMLDYERLSTEYSEPLFFSRSITIDDREYFSIFFYYNPSMKPFAWMGIYYSSSNGRLDKLFGAQFSQRSPETTEMLIENVHVPEDLKTWVSILRKQQN